MTRWMRASGLAAHGNAATGVSRRTWTADAARAGPHVSDPQPRSEPGDESAEGAVSWLGHSLWGYAGLCPALSRGMVRQDRARGGAPASGAALSTVGWIAGLAANPAPGVIGGEPETQSLETAAADSLHRSDSGRTF